MKDDTLYDNDNLKITYLHDPEAETKIISYEDHELWVNNKDNWEKYILQRGILKELANVVLENPSLLVTKLMNINMDVCRSLIYAGIDFSSVGQALVGAYKNEEKQFQEFLAKKD